MSWISTPDGSTVTDAPGCGAWVVTDNSDPVFVSDDDERLTDNQLHRLADHCADLQDIRARAGKHREHVQEVRGHWLHCSCGGKATVGSSFVPRV